MPLRILPRSVFSDLLQLVGPFRCSESTEMIQGTFQAMSQSPGLILLGAQNRADTVAKL